MARLIYNRLLKTLLISIITAICTVGNICGQSVTTQSVIDDIAEMAAGHDGSNEAEAEEVKEMLSALADAKIDINAATRQQLEALPFLSPMQVENILYYVYAYGPMESLDELGLIEGLDASTARLLRPFLTTTGGTGQATPGLAAMMRRGRSEITARLRRSLDDKRGYADVDEATRQASPGTYYLGSPLYQSVKYAYRYGDRMSIGVTAEKDPGEQFFEGTNAKGYDFYSAHFFVRDIGRLKALAVGDYKASFGRGLVMSNDFYMGKNVYMSSLYSRRGGLRRHASTDENNFMRGAGATVDWGKVEWTVMYSFRRLDANVENSLITSLKSDGYHRLARDIRARNAVANHLIGSNLTYHGSIFDIGMTVVGDFFNRPFTNDGEPYRAHYPEGRRFFNAGVHYDLRWRNIFIGGETAVDGRGRIATLNSIDIYPASGYRLFVLHRHYDRGYAAMHSRAMSSSGVTRNERGVMCGIEVTAVRSLSLSLAIDCYRHPWLRYGADRPSSGCEVLARAVCVPRDGLTFEAYYRRRERLADITGDGGDARAARTLADKLRLSMTYAGDERFEIRTYIDCCLAKGRDNKRTRGVALTQRASWCIPHTPLRCAAAFALFDTDDYDARIYIPSVSLPQTFYRPAAYGRGISFSALVGCDIRRWMSISAHCAVTASDDRDTIGSGPELSQGNVRSEVAAIATFRF